MKIKLLAPFFFLGFFVACQTPDDQPVTLNLPLQLQEGYGPFLPGFGILSAENDDYPKPTAHGNSTLPVRGIPKNWTNRVKSRLDLNSQQFFYQNYRAGKVDSVWYKGLKEYWKWTAGENELSEKPIKCYVYAVRGFDAQAGKWAVLVDTNNNLDFSDETAIYPETQAESGQDFSYKNPLRITYEVYQKGKIRTVRIPLVIKQFRGDFVYNFPQYASVVLKQEAKKYNLLVSSGFSRPDFESVQIAKKPVWFWQKNVNADELVERGEFITVGGVTYKNKGMDFYNHVLQLERSNPDLQDYLLQAGHPFQPFATKEFTTGKPVSLADYKGKFVYIDFWATWCKGCVQDMPELKKLHRKLDKNRFAILGIISNDSAERAMALIKKEALEWPQIYSDSTDKITQTYGINGLPVTVLLDPDGKIIAKDLRGKALTDRLLQLGLR